MPAPVISEDGGIRLVRVPYPAEWLAEVEAGMLVEVYELGRGASPDPIAQGRVAVVADDPEEPAVVLRLARADALAVATRVDRRLPMQVARMVSEPPAPRERERCTPFMLVSGGRKEVVMVDGEGKPCAP